MLWVPYQGTLDLASGRSAAPGPMLLLLLLLLWVLLG
jgi:hypothetical protein